MNTTSLHRFMLAAVMVSFGSANTPALAQTTTPKWKPTLESVTVSAGATRNWRAILTASHIGEAFVISASIEVPYSDLDLAREPDAAELGRRIHVAAHLVCQEMDLKYPPTQYPILEGYDCEHSAARDGMDRVDTIIASAKR